MNKAFIIVVIMISFFCIKEMSNYFDLSNNVICLTEDLDGESQDSDDSDSSNEEGLIWSGFHSMPLHFFLSASQINFYTDLLIKNPLNPFLEMHCPPPL